MGKSFKRRVREEDYEENEDYSNHKQYEIDKRKRKRIARAIRIKDLDTLLEEDIYGEELDG